MWVLRLGLCLFLLVVALPARAFDAFADTLTPSYFTLEGERGLRLQIKGAARLTFADLEGEGGLGFDSATDTATLGTRSPFARFDGLNLALRLETPVGMSFYSALDLGDGVTPQGAFLDYRTHLGELALHVEAGLNQPFVARFVRTARAPLPQRIYWGSREVHLVVELSGRGQRAYRWWTGVSVAMMRPLGAALVNDASSRRGTLGVLAYDDTQPFSGVSPVLGARAGIGLGPIELEGFAFMGQLSAERGVDELRNRIPAFPLLPGFSLDDLRDQDATLLWGGGRATFQRAGLEAIVEAVASKESLLTRAVLSSEFGYVFRRAGLDELSVFHTLEARIRLEHARLFEGPLAVSQTRALRAVDPSQAITWDWDVVTLALATDLYRDVLRVQLEHTFLWERNGAPSLGVDDVPFANDETLLQLVLRF